MNKKQFVVIWTWIVIVSLLIGEFIYGPFIVATLIAQPYCIVAGSSFQGLEDLEGGLFGSNAEAVSADGTVVVGKSRSSNSDDGWEAFRWENGVMTGLGNGLGDPAIVFMSDAAGVSADESIIVGYGTHPGFTFQGRVTEPVRWVEGVPEALGDLPGGRLGGSAYGVSANGEVVVGLFLVEFEDDKVWLHKAFLWASGTMENLGTSGVESIAMAAPMTGQSWQVGLRAVPLTLVRPSVGNLA